MGEGVSIGALEKSVRVLARKLTQQGFETEVDAVRLGRGSEEIGTSFVQLDITAPFKNEDGEEDESYVSVKFLASGYGATSMDEIGGASWTEMKRQAVEKIRHELSDTHKNVLGDYDDEDEGPPDEDQIRESAVIGMRGPNYSQYGASFTGKHLGTFGSMEEALGRIQAEMKRQNYYPDLYFINDHGNVSLLDAEGNEVRAWV